MRVFRGSTWRNTALRLGLLDLALLLTSCQFVAPQSAPPARLLVDPATGQSAQPPGSNPAASAATTASAPAVTYPVKRTTLRDTLTFTGKVVPARSAQLTFRGSGTVTTVDVTPGQSVKAGDRLAEFALDDESLRVARSQATLAELAYQTEQSKLEDLQNGASKDSVDQLRATVQRDQAEIQKLQQDKALADGADARAQQKSAIAKAAAERRVSLAQVALQAAKDNLTAAQATAQRAQDNAKAVAQRAQSDAALTLAAATIAVHAAQRQVDQATIKLTQTKMDWGATKAGQQLETQQFKVDLDNQALKEAQAAEQDAQTQQPSSDHTARQIDAEIKSTAAARRGAERALAADSLELKHEQANVTSATTVDDADVKVATLALEGAKEQLDAAVAAQQRAQAKNSDSARPATNADSSTTPTDPAIAQAAVKQAEHAVETAKLNLDEAQAAVDQSDATADASDSTPPFADHLLDAANSQLSADQARLTALQAGTSNVQITREQTRVDLLRDEAAAASTAAQPVVALTAPFDATVTQVGVTAGQTIVSGAAAGSASASLGDQPGDSRVSAIGLVAAGPNSIIADASETDVGQLSQGQSVDLNFPGLPGQTASGTIVEIGATGVPKDNNGGVSYPVRVALSAAPPLLKLGMTSQVTVNFGNAQDILVVPRDSVRTVNGATVVSKVDAQRQAQDVPVQVGRTLGSNVEVLAGLQEGDSVAVYQGTPTQASANGAQP